MAVHRNPLILLLLILFAFTGCDRPDIQKTGLRLVVDTTTKNNSADKQKKWKLKSLMASETEVDPAMLCFAVNITGSKIPNTTSGPSCDINRGIFKSLEDTDSLSVTVASGQAIKVELFGYLRSFPDQACPTDIQTQWNWPLDRVYHIDSKRDISTNAANVDILFQPTWPSLSQNIVVQNQWPGSCLPVVEDPLAGASLEILSGGGQIGSPGQALPLPFVVRALDKSSHPFMGVAIDWQILTGQGRFGDCEMITNINGEAQCFFILDSDRSVNNAVAATILGKTQSVLFNPIASSPSPYPNSSTKLSYFNATEFLFDSSAVSVEGGKAILRVTPTFQWLDSSTIFSNASVGTLDKVQWNVSKSALILDRAAIDKEEANSGLRPRASYTSRVFDGGTSTRNWTHLAWMSRLPFGKPLPDFGDYELPSSYADLEASNLMNQLVGLWHMDDLASSINGSTGAIKDSSATENHGSFQNGNLTEGRFKTSIHFSGSTDSYARIPQPQNLPLGNSPRTVMAWIKADTPMNSTWGSIVNWGNGDCTYRMFGLGTLSQRLMIWGGCYDYGTGLSIPTGEWVFVAAVFDGTNIRAYVNDRSASQAMPSYNTQPSDVFIAGESTDNQNIRDAFNGAVDEVAIWSRALSEIEIRQLYRRGSNRLAFEVRASTTLPTDPTTPAWRGANDSSGSLFSELYNSLANSLLQGMNSVFAIINFSNFPLAIDLSAKQYFQYRVSLESDDRSQACDYGSGPSWCSPELTQVMINQLNQPAKVSSIINKNALTTNAPRGFKEILGSSSCPTGIVYNLSTDKINWKYWNGSAWSPADGSAAKANRALEINSHIATFPTTATSPTLYIKAFLRSNGTEACELRAIELIQ